MPGSWENFDEYVLNEWGREASDPTANRVLFRALSSRWTEIVSYSPSDDHTLSQCPAIPSKLSNWFNSWKLAHCILLHFADPQSSQSGSPSSGVNQQRGEDLGPQPCSAPDLGCPWISALIILEGVQYYLPEYTNVGKTNTRYLTPSAWITQIPTSRLLKNSGSFRGPRSIWCCQTRLRYSASLHFPALPLSSKAKSSD